MIYVLNYANGEPYESYRKISTKTAKWLGKADDVFEFSSEDIPQSYKYVHKEIFAYKRGAGLWLWKPYVICKALEKINDGDWLMYLDSGTIVIKDLHHLVNHAIQHNQNIFLMEQPLLSRQFTKRECYLKMGMEDHGENQVLGLLLLYKNHASVQFVEEWLHLCEEEEMISPKHFHSEIEEWPDYYAHREDQSILNLLRLKYNLPVNRDPSDYGEMPFMYACKGYTYNPKIYPDSKYPTILLCNRKVHPYIYWIKYLLKHWLNKLGVFYTEKRRLSHLKDLKEPQL